MVIALRTLAKTIFLIEEIREKFKLTLKPQISNYSGNYSAIKTIIATIRDNFLNTKAFMSEDWKGPQCLIKGIM
jgi:hypothetical protein